MKRRERKTKDEDEENERWRSDDDVHLQIWTMKMKRHDFRVRLNQRARESVGFMEKGGKVNLLIMLGRLISIDM